MRSAITAALLGVAAAGPVQVFILMGQSNVRLPPHDCADDFGWPAPLTAPPSLPPVRNNNVQMLGMGKVVGNSTNGTLEFAVHNETKYQ